MNCFLLLRKTSSSSWSVWTLRFLFVLFYLSFIDAQKCTSSKDCSRDYASWQCCAGACVKGFNCLESQCNINADCSTDEVCCDEKCAQGWNCLGRTCSLDADCQWDETCCFGFCKENGDCVNITAVVIITSVAFVLFVSICCCVCRKITSVKQHDSNMDNNSSSEVNLSTTILIPVTNDGTSLSSAFTGGSSSSFPQKSTSYTSLESVESPPPYSKGKLEESRGGHALTSSYGATGK